MSVEILIRADAFQEEPSPAARQSLFPDTQPRNTGRALSASLSSPHLVNEVDTDDEDEHLWKKSRLSLVGNLFIVAIACMAMQTALLVNSSENEPKIINSYQSGKSLIDENGASESSANWTMFVFDKFIKILDCLIIPQYLIKKLGCKPTIFISFLSYMIFYLTTKFYPFTYVSYLGVFLNELLGNSFWVAALVFITDLAYLFIKATMFHKEFVLCLFYSIFYGLFYTSFIWDALIKAKSSSNSIMLASSAPNSTNQTLVGSTQSSMDSEKMLNFTIVLLSVFAALLTLLFLKRSGEKRIQLMSSNVKQLKNAYQWYIVPITLYLGMFQAFSFKYINQKLDDSNLWNGINFSIIVYSISILFGCLLVPIARKLISFNFLLIMSILINNLTILAVLLVNPNISIALKLTLPIILGLSVSTLEIILTCYYSLLFRGNEVTSLAFFVLWKTFGILIVLAINVSVLIECFLFIIVLAIGLVLHFVVIFFN